MNFTRALVLLFAFLEAGWLAFDGMRALRVGSFVTPQTGKYAGQVGPWRFLVVALGIEPNGRAMHWFFAVYGCIWLGMGVAFALRCSWAWAAMFALAAGSIWFLPFGTLASAAQIVLLLIWRSQFR